MVSDELQRRLREHDAEEERTTRPGRRRKFSRVEVHERLVEAAKAALVSHGVAHGLDAVRLDQSIVLANVPRTAAYELWDDDDLAPQEALRRDVAMSIVRDMPSGNALATRNVGLQAVSELEQEISSISDVAALRSARAAVIRAATKFNQMELNSQMWRVYRGIVSSAMSEPDANPQFLEAIRYGEVRLVESYEQLFIEFAELFRMVLRPQYSIRQFAMSVLALNEGLSNRTAAFEDQEVTIGGQDWTVFAIGCEALFDHYFTFDVS